MLFLHGILNSIWMIEESYASNYLPLVANFLEGKPVAVKSSGMEERKLTAQNGVLFADFKNGSYFISDYGGYSSPEMAPENSVAIISIEGAITKHDQDCGPAGMRTKAGLLNRCYGNPRIQGIVLRIDSGGGEGRAMQLLTDVISKRNKGVVAFVEDCACSAAYGIAAACDTVTLNSQTAMIGSIGTYMTVADYAEFWKMRGINLIEIYASKSTDKNREFYEAIKGNREPLLKICDTFNEQFIASIARYREGKISEDQSAWSTGKIFFADEAIKLGLADSVDSLENVINYFNI
ncbi:MAG: S49 family peptidase [Candidatus Symbiothrix sp.]|jgi:ClpP class serine protease|nr:S49 family peptidase [Candidatus Symbiothrix sp.]